MMNEIKTSRGVLLWRSPSVIENAKLLRVAKKALFEGDILDAKIAILEMIPELLDYSRMDIKNFDELNALGDEMTTPMMEIATSIIDKLIEVFAKKA